MKGKSPAKDTQVSSPTTSGLSSGVKSGLSDVMAVDSLDDGQRTKGGDHRPCPTSGTASERRNGKTFSWK